MQLNTNIANNLNYYNQKVKYDTACKRILSYRYILAYILKYCVDEFKDYDIQDIAFRYIEGQPQISEVAVHQDTTDRISTMNSEDTSKTDGDIYFDIKFYAIVPHHDEMVKIILNIEAQNNFYPGYPIIKRGIYYGSRMISSQYGTEFTDSHYEKIKKVYSIWICSETSNARRNTITKYEITEKNLVGHVKEMKENYDLITVIMICLGKEDDESENKLLRLLKVLLSQTRKLEEKKNILENEYKIPMTMEEESEVRIMCNLSEGIERRGIEKGMKKGIEKGIDLNFVESIQNLMNNLHIEMNEAMNLLNVPKDKRRIYSYAIMQQLN